MGRWIDWAGLRRYTLAVTALLAGACALMAVNTSFAGLVLTFYLLRLGGQGLMAHTAMTATARAFSRERGTGLALANLGGAAGEGVLPLAVAGGTAPIIMGFLIDAGVSLERQAVACPIYTVLASALATRVRYAAPASP